MPKTESIRPTIVIDTREQTPLAFTRLKSVPGTLRSGDYSVTGGEELFAVERKSLADLVACCMGDNRERFERELHRLRGYAFKRLLIIGSMSDIKAGNYRSQINPVSVMHTIAAFEVRYDVPVVFEPDAILAARLVEGWAYWWAREALMVAENIEKGVAMVNNTPD